jgi:hypothetical protein
LIPSPAFPPTRTETSFIPEPRMFWCCREGYIDWHCTRPEQWLLVTGEERTRTAGPVYIRVILI